MIAEEGGEEGEGAAEDRRAAVVVDRSGERQGEGEASRRHSDWGPQDSIIIHTGGEETHSARCVSPLYGIHVHVYMYVYICMV